MTLDDVVSVAAAPTEFAVAVSEKQEDTQEKVVMTLIDSVEASAPKASRDVHGTGGVINIAA